MELKQVTLNNNGMQQDLSISKDGKDFAYKNYNIRIQATGDGTLASVTNIKSPKKVNSYNIRGKVLNSILCGKYIVVFTHFYSSRPEGFIDYIYRIDLEDDFAIRILYEGSLNFSYDRPIDSTYYYENDKVQKVYWVDGWTSDGNNNYPRVINIITEGERDGGNFTSYPTTTNFDFYPELKYIPTISAVKNFDVPSELPAGMIQYFVSFFNKNKSETLIAAGTSLYSIDFKDKGAKADSTGCAFDVTINIQNESTSPGEWESSYEYIRLYSVRRTSLNGDATVNIVKDFKVETNITSYTVLDNGIGQDTIDPGQIFFVGGTPLFAKTLCQKDNTLFMGGIKTEGVLLSTDIKNALHNTINIVTSGEDVISADSGILTENNKTIPVSEVPFNDYYPYSLQKDNEAIISRTFKVGEVYRFGIQFQTKQGQWSEVVWIGDKKIENHPTYNNGTISVSNIIVSINSALSSIFTNLETYGFTNYRLVMADPELSNGRSILAQGVVCPTMFTPSLRTQNSPHTINSWIMRPRKGKAPYHHLEPLAGARFENSELSTYDPKYKIIPKNYQYYTMPFDFVQDDAEQDEPNINVYNDINFYIDESIVNLYSPDLTDNTIIKGRPKFRIVGTVPLTINYSNIETLVNPIGIDLDYIPDIDKSKISDYRINDASYSDPYANMLAPLYSMYAYIAPSWETPIYNSDEIEKQTHVLDSYYKSAYNIHMWQHSGSIVGFNIADDKVRYDKDKDDTPSDYKELPAEPLVLQSNTIYNHLYSKNSIYFKLPLSYNTNLGVKLYNKVSDEETGVLFEEGSSNLYYGSLDYIHSNPETNIWRNQTSSWSQPVYRSKIVSASTPITFNSVSHAIFHIGTDDNNKISLLPRFVDETEYKGIFTGKYSAEHRGGGANHVNMWRDLSTPTSNDCEKYIFNILKKRLYSGGIKIKTPWIDNFVSYKQGEKTDVYESGIGYKQCCSACISHDPQTAIDNEIAAFFENHYDILENYNYIEDGKYTFVIMVGDTGMSPMYLKKCTWSSPEDLHPTSNVTITDLDEVNVSYPMLWYQGVPYNSFWEDTSTEPTTTYNFIFSNYDEDNEYVVGAIKRLDSFEICTGEFIYSQDVIDAASVYINPGENPSSTTVNHGDYPYLFMGELYYEIEYKDLYGGISDTALSKLTWIPISNVISLGTAATITEGDTYYQRWDCLKTFPKTPEDINQVVDITSFMVETHINLDERTGPNRANFNMVVNPTNFNLFNDVYNQKNNLFSYTTINDLLSEENSHQVSWSLTKNIAGTVDTWTNITSANVVNLKHPVTKLVNFNNKVVGLTEHSVEIINFNARNLVPTDDNTFIELKNSAKVDGTIDFTIDKGSRNSSVLVTEVGMYFIDDNENSLIRINYKGEIQNLGIGKMDSWFKQHIISGTYTKNNANAFHLEYDAKHKDIYICNDEVVLVYNEQLNTFTSFVDYQELVSLFTNNGSTYALATYSTTGNYLYELYGGSSYGHGFEIFDGINKPKDLPYSIQYRVNPGPYSDKVFTNIAFKADLNVSQNNSTTSNIKPFDYIQAWTEYQDTLKQPLVYDRLSNLREKFRTWRALIPRNNGTRDRIRNPWMHLKLTQDKDSVGQKLEFHNISVTYME